MIRGGYGIFYSQVYGQIADVAQTLGVLDSSGRPVTDLTTCSASPDACSRQIAQIFVPLQGIPGLSSAAIFQTLFAQGRVSCTTPTGGAAACITPADLIQFGINITHTGAIPPLTVLFSGQPDYRNPYSQQAELGIEREIAKGLSVSASYI